MSQKMAEKAGEKQLTTTGETQVGRYRPSLQLVHKRKLLNEEGRKLTEAEAMVRERQQRDFKDDFKPADTFEGPKEGYYFTSGPRGLGYYLDPRAYDVNDPDPEGYVLVRTAPAVAVHRVQAQRDLQETQGLIFAPKVLDSLGNRYKVITAPWMGGMRPPRETFEKDVDDVASNTVYGRNELLHERYEYLANRIKALERRRRRRHSQDDDDDDDEEETAIVLSEHRELALVEAASDKPVTIDARGGPLTLRGEDLLPVAPHDGPWAVLLEHGAPLQPFAFKATLKKAQLKWPVSKLLSIFADKYNAKYDHHFDSLRLFVTSTDFATEDTLLAELISDWDGPVAAKFTVKPKLGSGGSDARALVSARGTALAKQRDLTIDEWSTQAQVVQARMTQPYKGPMTSEEIRDYWEQHKHDKHWRTDAALRGYATRTDDQAKLAEWKTNRLVKNPGFLLSNDSSSSSSKKKLNKPLYPNLRRFPMAASMSLHEAPYVMDATTGMPIGPPVASREPAKAPEGVVLEGRYCRLEVMEAKHGPELYKACTPEGAEKRFLYLPESVPSSQSDLDDWIREKVGKKDPMFYVVIDKETGTVQGRQSFLRIDLVNKSIEIGNIYWGPAMAKTRVATEANFLFMQYAFEVLGMRRYEWKCDALHVGSRNAAIRFGFTYEGHFRRHYLRNGRSRDTAWHSIIDDEYPRLKNLAYVPWLQPENFDGLDQRSRLSLLTKAALLTE